MATKKAKAIEPKEVEVNQEEEQSRLTLVPYPQDQNGTRYSAKLGNREFIFRIPKDRPGLMTEFSVGIHKNPLKTYTAVAAILMLGKHPWTLNLDDYNQDVVKLGTHAQDKMLMERIPVTPLLIVGQELYLKVLEEYSWMFEEQQADFLG